MSDDHFYGYGSNPISGGLTKNEKQIRELKSEIERLKAEIKKLKSEKLHVIKELSDTFEAAGLDFSYALRSYKEPKEAI